MTSHGTFEWGVATAIVPLRFKLALPTEDEIKAFRVQEISDWYRSLAQEIAKLDLYDTFLKTGWTMKLTRKVRRELAPRIVRGVTLAWYGALYEARQKG